MKNAKLIKLQADFCQSTDCSVCPFGEMSGGDCLNYRQRRPKKVVKFLKQWETDKKIAELMEEIERKQAKIDDLTMFLSYYREKGKARKLIEDVKQACSMTNDYRGYYKKIEKLSETIEDINYRDYITRTRDGKVCIDIDQFFYELT